MYYSPTGVLEFTAEHSSERPKIAGNPAVRSWRQSCKDGLDQCRRAPVTKRDADEWTIERWKTEPRLVGLEFSDASVEQAPPLWKDLMLASALAVLLWGAAAVVFG